MDERFKGLTNLETCRRAVELFAAGQMTGPDFQTVYLDARHNWISAKDYAPIEVQRIDEEILFAIDEYNEFDHLRQQNEYDEPELRGIVTTLLSQWRKMDVQSTQLRFDFAGLDVVSRAKLAIELFAQGELSSSQFLEYFPTHEKLPSRGSPEGIIIHEARIAISHRSEWDEISLRADILPLADRMRALS